jgi:hypothetical protein
MAKPRSIRSNRATEFSNDLLRMLQGRKLKPSKKFGDLVWCKNHPLANRQTVDVAAIDMRDRQPVLFIEAELLREDPSSNVIKIWKWANARGGKKPLLFIQSFTKPYRTKKKRERYERAIFAAKQMSAVMSNVEYRSVRLNYNPRRGGKVGAGRRRHHAQNLGHSVIRYWNAFQKNHSKMGTSSK